MSKPCDIILLDGGLGTTLTSKPYNVTFDNSTPLWSSHLLISDPKTLLAAQSSFVKAGADVVITATYQASFEGFAATGCGVEKKFEVERLMRSAVGLARDAFQGVKEGKVALSLGAYGAVMIPSQEYSGNYDEKHQTIEKLRDWHLERLNVFLPSMMSKFSEEKKLDEEEVKERRECWSNVDLIAFETLPLVQEIIAARETIFLAKQSLKEEDRKPFWISCVFPSSEDQNYLPDGSNVREVVEAMLGKREGACRPMGIGINCTKVSKGESLVVEFENAVKEVLDEEAEEGGVSLVLYPDGTKVGESYNTTTKEWEVSGEGIGGLNQKAWDKEVFEIVRRAKDRGIWNNIYVGGCCRTGAEEIGRLRTRIDKY